jgi:TldD protein
LLLDANLVDQIPQLIDEAEAALAIPSKPIEVGRYDLVCDAAAMANLVGGTLGTATELDRCLGYEANAGGTSYLGPAPFARLGTALGTSHLNVHADRSMPQGLATVKWDDEGVEPDTFPIVDNGILVDYQTTREQAPWLKAWYAKRGQPVRSHGCAAGRSALAMPMQMAPNLILMPGKDNIGFADLVANTKRGIAVLGGTVSMDFQSREGTGYAVMREIANGKLGPFIVGGGVLFDSTELWKSLQAIGGASSREQFPAGEVKGEPAQSMNHSIAAVPGAFKGMAVVDVRRKA